MSLLKVLALVALSLGSSCTVQADDNGLRRSGSRQMQQRNSQQPGRKSDRKASRIGNS